MQKRVIAFFPEFERADLIAELRGRFDPLAVLVKPHITLVPPFENAMSLDHLISHIEHAARQVKPFEIRLQGVTGHENEYLFLNVKRGNDQIIELRDLLYTGELSPHLLAEYTYVPHLTVGRLGDGDSFAAALAVAKRLTATFEWRADRISVYSIQADGARPVEYKIRLKS